MLDWSMSHIHRLDPLVQCVYSTCLTYTEFLEVIAPTIILVMRNRQNWKGQLALSWEFLFLGPVRKDGEMTNGAVGYRKISPTFYSFFHKKIHYNLHCRFREQKYSNLSDRLRISISAKGSTHYTLSPSSYLIRYQFNLIFLCSVHQKMKG